ncbi:MAG: galactokinase [Treponema sp.]|nr:galactokinase [Treponema sp.]
MQNEINWGTKYIYDAHEREYKTAPDVVATAPGRIHCIGEHSWFFKDKTLSMAITVPVFVAVSERTDSLLRFYFPQREKRKRANLSSLTFKREDRWANAVKAVIFGYAETGFPVRGMNITVSSDLQPSVGFGITTAIKVAVAVAMRELFGASCSERAMLAAIEKGNRVFLNMNYYRADVYTALYGKRGCLVLTDHATNRWDVVPFPFHEKKILLTDAGVPRVSVWDEERMQDAMNVLLLGELREQKNGVWGGWQYENSATEINEVLSVVSEDMRRKLLCIMREHGDVLEAYQALRTHDFGRFSRAVNHSHESMRDLYELSCPEIDWLLKRVGELEPNLAELRNPVTCGRITGKGFGRCLYAVVRDGDVAPFKKKLEEYERIFGFHPSCYDVVPADGAHIVLHAGETR